MFSNDEWMEMTSLLLDRTESDAVKWERNLSSFVTSYIAYLDDVRFELFAIDDDGRYPYRLALTRMDNGSWVEVGRFDTPVDGDLDDEVRKASSNVGRLFDLVERQVTGAPALFKSIMSKLNSATPTWPNDTPF